MSPNFSHILSLFLYQIKAKKIVRVMFQNLISVAHMKCGIKQMEAVHVKLKIRLVREGSIFMPL